MQSDSDRAEHPLPQFAIDAAVASLSNIHEKYQYHDYSGWGHRISAVAHVLPAIAKPVYQELVRMRPLLESGKLIEYTAAQNRIYALKDERDRLAAQLASMTAKESVATTELGRQVKLLESEKASCADRASKADTYNVGRNNQAQADIKTLRAERDELQQLVTRMHTRHLAEQATELRRLDTIRDLNKLNVALKGDLADALGSCR